ncbi:MAG: hypothetical protein J5I93_20795, partial [Pirellulaceae bacterium]|nr:hypothetical protein [Pirellulaceae bacterium]
MDHRIERQLRGVAARFRSVRLWTSLGMVWLGAATVGLLLLWLRTEQPALAAARWWMPALGAAVVGGLLAARALASFRNPQWLAAQVEACYPGLQQRLLTAVSLRPPAAGGSYTYLQQNVVRETLNHAWKYPWVKTVPGRRVAAAHLLHLLGLMCLLIVLSGLAWNRPPAQTLAGPAASPEADGKWQYEIEPGDTEIERGMGMLVLTRFTGAVPAEMSLHYSLSDGKQLALPMNRSLDDPLFGAHVPEVTGDLTYHVTFADQRSRDFRVTVFEYPALVRSDAVLSFPDYTQAEDKRVDDTRRVSAVEGSRLTWICHLNKQVKTAELVDDRGEVLPLAASDEGPHAYSASVTLRESRTWKLRLVDAEGRANKQQVELSAKVLPNRPPELKLELARDARVSPLEEFPVQASVTDDYGLTRFGISYALGGEDPRDVPLGENSAARQTQRAEYVLDFERLEAQPDQLLSYHFWAEDMDADGQPRRTFSDMFFAEVRHFEEIFREGEQPPGGEQQQRQQQQGQSGGAGQQAEELAELQKQIINATWRLIRRETRPEVSPPFREDVQLLIESQDQALEQLDQLAEQAASPDAAELIAPVRDSMRQASQQLTEALEKASPVPLRPALSAEQAAYQGLLRLRAREFEVTRGQQQQQSSSSSSSGQSSSRSRQQLEQLELSNDQNRYETQRQAQESESESAEQRETRQTLNRLSDLARRQSDLNQRLQELQSALEAAENEQQREELQRQLKRLRDQQEQLLRETDELVDRMNQSPASNQQANQDARQQLEENRENVRQTAESLEEGDVPQALSAGTRAEREFEQLRDEFRQQAADQFTEEARDLRQQARELDRQQTELGERLANLDQPQPGSLRGADAREDVERDLRQQQQDLDKLLERMQETVLEAEAAEPLLAQKLYDAFRQASQRRVGDRLEAASELLNRGFQPQAAEQEQQAREGISQLRQGVEQAAESVLGDETEALRRAVGELDELARRLNQEIQRADPNAAGQPEPGEQQPGQQQPGQQQPGQQQPGQQQPGQQQPGQQQPGQQQPGQQQPGQQQPGQQQPGQQQPGQQQPGQQQPGQQQPGQQQPGQQQPGQQKPEQQQPEKQQPRQPQP